MTAKKAQSSGALLSALVTLLALSIAGNLWMAYHHVNVVQLVIPVPPPAAKEERYEHAPGSSEWHPNFGEPSQFCGMFGAEHCSHAT